MERNGRIVTIGVAPAWDVDCRGRDLDWGRHVHLDEQVVRPAGKSLNVSRALAWMGLRSVAAGLWGRDDYDRMQTAMARLGELIQVRMTAVEGRTRENITVIDTANHREMHLRRRSDLACRYSLERLNADLGRFVRHGDLCVFAGAMPAEGLLEPTVELVRTGRNRRAWVAVDTCGPALTRIAQEHLACLMAPNVQEFRDVLGAEVPDEPARLAQAARPLLGEAGMILISRGRNGAVLAGADGTWIGRCPTRREVISTVGCGDYLLAGFLAAFQQSDDSAAALAAGLKVATARAWGWTESKTWQRVEQEVAVEVERL